MGLPALEDCYMQSFWYVAFTNYGNPIFFLMPNTLKQRAVFFMVQHLRALAVDPAIFNIVTWLYWPLTRCVHMLYFYVNNIIPHRGSALPFLLHP